MQIEGPLLHRGLVLYVVKRLKTTKLIKAVQPSELHLQLTLLQIPKSND